MIKEDLVFFLRNGRLENIDFGTTRHELESVLGEPESWGVYWGDERIRERSSSGLYVYDNFEFYFDRPTPDARLVNISVNSPVRYTATSGLCFTSYGWTTNLKLEDALEFLTKHGIETVRKSHPVDEDIFFWLETDAGVRIFFTKQNDDVNWTLYKFGREAKELL